MVDVGGPLIHETTGTEDRMRLRNCSGIGIAAAGLFALAANGVMAATESRPGPDFIVPADPVTRRALPIEVADPNEVARTAWPISGGIPIPRGELRNVAQVRLLDPAGKEQPIQCEILGYWPEVKREGQPPIPASVMWLGVTFLADIPAKGKATFTLEYGTQVKPMAAPAKPVKATPAGDSVTLDNGLVSLKLGKGDEARKVLQSLREGWQGAARASKASPGAMPATAESGAA